MATKLLTRPILCRSIRLFKGGEMDLEKDIKELMAKRGKLVASMNQAKRQADGYATEVVKTEGAIEALVKLQEEIAKTEVKKDG